MLRAMRVRLLAAFAAVYTIWGSTYLAIRFAVETLPPLLMAGARFIIAGAILLLWSRLRERDGGPSAQDWLTGLVSGALLLLGGKHAQSLVFPEPRQHRLGAHEGRRQHQLVAEHEAVDDEVVAIDLPSPRLAG